MKTGSQHDHAFDLPYDEMIRLYNEGVGVLSIAVRLDVPAHKVRRYLYESSRVAKHRDAGKSKKYIKRIMTISQTRLDSAFSSEINKKYYFPHEGEGLPDYMI
tara:strand:- start:2870 stop:3178 length:309 start_codon:yes stop_codon:yes gene_type:complete